MVIIQVLAVDEVMVLATVVKRMRVIQLATKVLGCMHLNKNTERCRSMYWNVRKERNKSRSRNRNRGGDGVGVVIAALVGLP